MNECSNTGQRVEKIDIGLDVHLASTRLETGSVWRNGMKTPWMMRHEDKPLSVYVFLQHPTHTKILLEAPRNPPLLQITTNHHKPSWFLTLPPFWSLKGKKKGVVILIQAMAKSVWRESVCMCVVSVTMGVLLSCVHIHRDIRVLSVWMMKLSSS